LSRERAVVSHRIVIKSEQRETSTQEGDEEERRRRHRMAEAQHLPRSITKGSIHAHTQGSKSVETIDKCEDRKCKTKCELETNTYHKASQYRQRDTDTETRREERDRNGFGMQKLNTD
jgi:hypothetical protein